MTFRKKIEKTSVLKTKAAQLARATDSLNSSTGLDEVLSSRAEISRKMHLCLSRAYLGWGVAVTGTFLHCCVLCHTHK